jgi:hypothetical protein
VNVLCWNCSTTVSESSRHCTTCGQLVRPDAAQRERARDCIEYVISELRRWTSVPGWWKGEAEASYRKRLHLLASFPEDGLPTALIPEQPALEREEVPIALQLAEQMEAPQVELASPASPSAHSVPASPWARPSDTPARQRSSLSPLHDFSIPGLEDDAASATAPLAREQAATTPSQAQLEADQAFQMLREALSEKRIVWLYGLGGLLLLSAGVGYLRSAWDGIGRQLMALLLTALPFVFFWLAGRLQERLPLSSRMFNVLGGGLLPVGLLSINTFLGLQAPGQFWNPFAFLIGWWVNLMLSRKAKEPVCLYLAGLCWALAAWSSTSGLILGLASFGAALFLFLKTRGEPDLVHHERLAHAFSMLGLLAAFTRGPLEAGTAGTLFLLAIAYFSTLAWLTSTTQALTLSSVVCVLCFWWMTSLFQWPAASVGLAALLQATLYLFRASQLHPESEPARQIPQLSAGLVSLVLALFLAVPLLYHLPSDFAEVPVSQLLTCAVTGILAAVYYGFVAYRERQPAWAYGSTLCLIYGYFSLVVLAWRGEPALYRPWLIGFVLLWQAAVFLLRRRVPAAYLRPWVWSACGMACLLVPLNMALQMAHADRWTPWIYLAATVVTALAAVFERDSRGVYVSLGTAALAYGTWLPIWFGQSSEPNLGLAFTPFVAGLGCVGAAMLRSPSTRPYAQPLVSGAALLAAVFAWMQCLYVGHGYWNTVGAALVIYGGMFAAAGWALRGDLREASWLHAGLSLLGALACVDRGGPLGIGAGLLVSAALVLVPAVPRGFWAAAILATATAALIGPTALKIWPGMIWLAAAARSSTPQLRLAVGASFLLMPAWFSCWHDWRVVLLLTATLTQAWLALRWSAPGLLALVWLQSKVVYVCALHFDSAISWSVALWLEWLGWYLLSRRTQTIALEICTWATLLAISTWHGGFAASINGWLSVAFLLWRGVTTGRAETFFAYHLTLLIAVYLSVQQSFFSAEFGVGLLFAWGLVDLALARRQPQLLQNMVVISFIAWLCCFAGGPGFVPALLVGAAVWAVRSFTTQGLESPSPVGLSALWVTFALAYHAYGSILLQNHVTQVELYTLPAGLWLLLWGGALSDSPASRQLGIAAVLVPSLFLSLFSGSSALWAGSLALAVLFLGQAIGRANYVAWGALALVAEIVIQSVSWAVNVPWHVWAVTGGILVVTLAFVLERKRQAVLDASRSFVEKLNAW